MKFKPLLVHWKKEAPPVRTAEEYAVRLDLDDASRLHALAELFPGQPLEVISGAVERDKFLSPLEAKEFGLVDEVVEARPSREDERGFRA